MKKETVVFIGFQEQDNLGIGYMASALLDVGYSVKIIDFRVGNEQILRDLIIFRPLVVGFSIIFQHYIQQFSNLINYLRENGIQYHFCAGGHFPSLRPAELLEMVPELDSVVLFEGELTFIELVNLLKLNRHWKDIKGIAYVHEGSVKINPLRPLEKDLDNFTPPVRPPLKEYAAGKKFATLLAGRGCIHNCSFCSIHEFYARPPGKIKRVRQPEMVVREMELLFHEQSCSVFMFQDDDFPLIFEKSKKWITSFCQALEKTGLTGKIIWKINCRPDEVDYEVFAKMKACGLFLVYLGIESGNNDGLQLMNKHCDVSVNLKAVRILNDLDILYDYGFMLFDPESTFESVEKNLHFLEDLCGDGSSPVTFCKMMPYAETKIEKLLQDQGRLNGSGCLVDYYFRDPKLDELYDFMAGCFSDWIGDHEGLLNLARWSRYFMSVYENYYNDDVSITEIRNPTIKLLTQSNKAFFDLALRMVKTFKTSGNGVLHTEKAALMEEVSKVHKKYCRKFNNQIDRVHAMYQVK